MNKTTIFLFLITFAFMSCKKEEGPGGMATVKGKIRIKDYSGSIFTGNEYDGVDVDVFIIYGTGSNMFDDNIKSSFDGSFEFRYLRPGNYTVFVYSKEPADVQDKTPVIQSFEITDKKQTVDLGTITIKD